MNIKILIAMHKPYQVPEDRMYMPIHVGAQGKAGIRVKECSWANVLLGTDEDICICGDNQGDNISEKNSTFCELTGLYYAWKNIDADVIGLVHYRRYFAIKKKAHIKRFGKFRSVLTSAEANELLSEADMIVPDKRKYYIETLYSHYAHTFDGSHLDLTRDIIKNKYPEYLPYVERAFQQKWGYMFNMAIMPKDLVDEYCTWLFDILFDLEKQVDTTGLDSFTARLFGRVSEILFNVWILKKLDEGFTVVECPVIDMEYINWTKKKIGFLEAKFLGKKYTESM